MDEDEDREEEVVKKKTFPNIIKFLGVGFISSYICM
jgi:hypothetical protein